MPHSGSARCWNRRAAAAARALRHRSSSGGTVLRCACMSTVASVRFLRPDLLNTALYLDCKYLNCRQHLRDVLLRAAMPRSGPRTVCHFPRACPSATDGPGACLAWSVVQQSGFKQAGNLFLPPPPPLPAISSTAGKSGYAPSAGLLHKLPHVIARQVQTGKREARRPGEST